MTTGRDAGGQGLHPFGHTDTLQYGDLALVDIDLDAFGRPDLVTVGSGASARVVNPSYDSTGFMDSLIDSLGRTHSFGRDSIGRVTSRTRPDLAVVSTSYDDNGNMDGITPASQPQHAFGHDTTDRMTSYTPPVVTGVPSPTTTYAYSTDHQLLTVTRPDAQLIELVYDPVLARLDEVTTPLGDYLISYDTEGRASTVTDPHGGSITYGYDGSLTTSETLAGTVSGSVSWTYDNDFRVVSESVNGGSTIAFTYDDDGGLTSAGAETLTLEPLTGLVSDVDVSAISTSIDYDEFAAIVFETSTDGVTTLFEGDYTRDAAGRITSFTELSDGTTRDVVYTYDLAGRLETVTQDTVLLATYGYDDNGNRTSLTTPGGTIIPTYDDQDRLTSYGNVDLYYNENGELEQRDDTVALEVTDYVYDVMGNLRQVTLPDTTVIDYVTDARDRRVGKKVDGLLERGWLYGDQLEPVAELDGTGAVVSRFVYGRWPHVPDYMVKGGVTYRILTDHIGSVRLVVNAATGAVAQRLDYDEWGNVLTDTAPAFQPFGFAGGLYDPDTELVRFGARDYDPFTGRWLSKDPIRFDGGGENLYEYVVGDPVNLIDRSGRAWGAAAAGACAAVPGCAAAAASAAAWGTTVLWGSLMTGAAWVCFETGYCRVDPDECPANDDRYERPLPNNPRSPPFAPAPDSDDDGPDCEEILARDNAICASIRGKRAREKRAVCYGSAMQRYGNCLAGRPLGPLSWWWDDNDPVKPY